jgi:hypothetical protein
MFIFVNWTGNRDHVLVGFELSEKENDAHVTAIMIDL